MLTNFDHVTIVVHDVGAAARTYETLLGSPPSWRGEHPELGTEGALFALSNAVVELAGPRAGAPEADALRDLLASRGEGLQAIAFGTADAGALTAGLRAKGVRATPPQPGQARGADGAVREYQTVDLSPRSTRGLNVLAVQRDAGLFAHGAPAADVVDSLDHVVVRTSDPGAAIALYRDALGVRLALDQPVRGVRMLFFRIGGVTIEIIEDASAGPTDVLTGLAYRVKDIDAARARMAGAGLSVSEVRDGAKPGTRVFTVRDGTRTVPTLIVRDPARDKPDLGLVSSQ